MTLEDRCWEEGHILEVVRHGYGESTSERKALLEAHPGSQSFQAAGVVTPCQGPCSVPRTSKSGKSDH